MMESIYKKLGLACFLLAAPIALSAQVLKEVQSKFDSYHQAAFQEKIFVHTDKEQYVTGELLWFKIYNVNAFTNLPADLSKVVYVEVLDQSNQPVAQAKISMKKGSGNGSIYIPLTMVNGNYKFRAYTNWMQNFGANHFFEKQITIFNPLSSPENVKKNTVEHDLQFFPEGGEMVEGISCNIGFKAMAADGKGIALKGVIVNQKNDTVARFQTLKFGIGQFKFTPLVNQTYKVIASTAQKEIIIKELPIAKKQGYTMLLEEGEGNMTLTVCTNLNPQNIYLFVHQGMTTSLAEAAGLTNGKSVFRIDKNKLSEGLSHFTIFNTEGEAVAERLYFKRPTKILKISANADLLAYKPRQKVNVTIDANTEKNQPMPADVSIAIRKLDSLQVMDQSDIESYFWLSAELKGNIESPSYYFRNPTKESDKALDNLLLTQGWRRMVWGEVMNKKPLLKFLPEFNGHLVSGKLNNPSRDHTVYLTISNSTQQFYNTLTDSTGHFIFNTKDFYGPNEIIVQTNPNIDTTSVITIKSPFSEQFTPFVFSNLDVKPSLLNELQRHSFGMQVQNIYAADQLKKFYPLNIDTTKFYGVPFKSYNLDDYTRFDLMEDVLREYVRETFISKNLKHFKINVLGKTALLEGEPLVLVDGAPYFNTDKVMEIDPKKIKKLSIARDHHYYGPSLFDGILDFTSYKPNAAALEINPNAVVIDYEGMQLQREFYSPSYESAEKLNSRLPDLRNLLFWSPSIMINETGSTKLDFYTSDQPGIYIGVVNGLSKSGIPGSNIFTFEVKP